jgi:hypothetical protein
LILQAAVRGLIDFRAAVVDHTDGYALFIRGALGFLVLGLVLVIPTVWATAALFYD